MLNLYSLNVKGGVTSEKLTNGEKLSVLYHDVFDYPLDFADLIRWRAVESSPVVEKEILVRNGHVFINGKEGLVYKKSLRKRISVKKVKLAKKAALILSKMPGVRMIGLTGSLAMDNATEDGDIDFLIITKNESLWTTRAASLLILPLLGIKIRHSGDSDQKDKICLNMWLTENNMNWKYSKNFYTAHEIAQIKPLFSRNKTYEKFLYQNKWVLNFWPNSVKIKKINDSSIKTKNNKLSAWLENFLFKAQFRHMAKKITREVVKSDIALFHPQDWGKFVETRLSS